MDSFARFFEEHRGDYSALLFDVDGTLIWGKKPLPGAPELLEKLRQIHFPFLILTNDCSRNPVEKAQLLCDCGLAVAPEELISAGHPLADWARDHYRGGKFFLYSAGAESNFYAESAGVAYTVDPDELDDCCGVIILDSIAPISLLNKIFNFFIRHPQAELISPNPDHCYPDGRGKFYLASAGVSDYLVSALAETGIEKEAVFFGKPFAPIYACALDRLRQLYPEQDFTDHSRIVMIGDSLYSDVRGGNRAGFVSVLLATGLVPPEAAQNAAGDLRPQLVFRQL